MRKFSENEGNNNLVACGGEMKEIGDAAFLWEHFKKVLPVSSFISSIPI